MKRRDFLLLRATSGRTRGAELSCERLYMRYVDAEAEGTTPALFETLAGDLRKTSAVRLIETSWLAHDDLRSRLDAVLDAFAARGGEVERKSA